MIQCENGALYIGDFDEFGVKTGLGNFLDSFTFFWYATLLIIRKLWNRKTTFRIKKTLRIPVSMRLSKCKHTHFTKHQIKLIIALMSSYYSIASCFYCSWTCCRRFRIGPNMQSFFSRVYFFKSKTSRTKLHLILYKMAKIKVVMQ